MSNLITRAKSVLSNALRKDRATKTPPKDRTGITPAFSRRPRSGVRWVTRGIIAALMGAAIGSNLPRGVVKGLNAYDAAMRNRLMTQVRTLEHLDQIDISQGKRPTRGNERIIKASKAHGHSLRIRARNDWVTKRPQTFLSHRNVSRLSGIAGLIGGLILVRRSKKIKKIRKGNFGDLAVNELQMDSTIFTSALERFEKSKDPVTSMNEIERLIHEHGNSTPFLREALDKGYKFFFIARVHDQGKTRLAIVFTNNPKGLFFVKE